MIQVLEGLGLREAFSEGFNAARKSIYVLVERAWEDSNALATLRKHHIEERPMGESRDISAEGNRELYTHNKKGGEYFIVDPDWQIRSDVTGEWLASVAYKAADQTGPTYVTSRARFNNKFSIIPPRKREDT